jgi:23S rRNA (adenine2503-C2)-methyltransferase
MGYLRNLSTGEIIDQVLQVRRISGRRITNVVFMGMGEPMMNYAAVMVAADIMVHGMQIAARRITVSTAGWVDGIRKMADERRRVKLALSLHSVSDEVRSRLMPVNRRHGLEDILRALEYYYGRTGMRPTYEYIFFEGVNDSPEEIRRLIRFARAVPCKINVIPYHSIAFTHPQGLGAALRPSLRVEAIVEELRAANLTVMIRSNAGEDITAACGQLAAGQRRNRNTAGTHHRGPASPTYSQRHTQRHATTTFRASGSGEGNTGETPR